MKSPKKLSVGQQLFWEPTNSHRESTRMVVVTRVGRKWATLDNGERVDLDTLWADGGQYSSPGRCWPSEQAYRVALEADQIWMAFKRSIQLQGRNGAVTAQDIRRAAAILYLQLEKP